MMRRLICGASGIYKIYVFNDRCLFYEFITRETLIQCKQGECEYDILIKLFKVLGYPGVVFFDIHNIG